MFVVDGQDAHRLPGPNRSEGQRCIGSAGQDDVRLTAANGVKGLPNCMCTGSAGGDDGVGRTLRSEMRRHSAGRGVVHRPGDHGRRHAQLPFLVDAAISGIERLASAETRANQHAEAVRVNARLAEIRLRCRFLRRDQSKAAEAIESAKHPLVRRQRHLAGDPAVQL